ncbi:FxSxx-COOH system tetratricopeptide repeat protein [Longispora urticae]
MKISNELKTKLGDALFKIKDLHDPEIRQFHISYLQASLGRPLTVKSHSSPKWALLFLLDACCEDRATLDALFKVVRELNQEHSAVAEADQLLEELDPLILASDARRALAGLIGAVDLTLLRDSFHDRIGAPSEGEPPDWFDTLAVIKRAELSVAARGGLPPFLMWIDRLAHGTENPHLSEDMHGWMVSVGLAAGLEPSTLRRLCITLHIEAPQGAILGESQHSTVLFDSNTDISVEIETAPSGAGSQQSGDDVVNRTTVITSTQTVESQDPIRGGVPSRNMDFTGRDTMISDLRQQLVNYSKAAVVPQALYGMGGVGKTQIAAEYVYQHTDSYDLVWWIPAEQPSMIRASLAMLGDKLALQPNEDMHLTAKSVLDALATSPRRWLLVYDNADEHSDIRELLPSAGGHVIITSRNREWADVYKGIEVTVFDRAESIELVGKRSTGITQEEADLLAQRLGDLPLALAQAAGWLRNTGMPVGRYVELLEARLHELMQEKSSDYPTTMSAILSVALEKLRAGNVPAAGQLLELFAYLSPDPISAGSLRAGRGAHVTEPLASALNDEIQMGRAIRELGHHSLARVDTRRQRLQVHRLVQMVLRTELRGDRQDSALANVRRILAAANPGSPDEDRTWQAHAEIGPHIGPADLIGAPWKDARQVVLDQMRYLYVTGDYRASRELAEQATVRWSAPEAEGGLGADHIDTLLANRHLANALRQLGSHEQASQLLEDTFERLRTSPEFGEDHEHTVDVGLGIGFSLRIEGDFRTSLERDLENFERARRVYRDDTHRVVLNAKTNVAAAKQALGDFEGAYEIDAETLRFKRETLGPNDASTLWSVSRLARDLYRLGRYDEALKIQSAVLPTHRALLTANHNDVLLATRTEVMCLRKTGRHEEAVRKARDLYHSYHAHFGPDNQNALAAAISYANALRAVSRFQEALSLATETVDAYGRVLSPDHPLTLMAAVNLGIILRATSDRRGARQRDEKTHKTMIDVLGAMNPFTLCAANSVANNLANDHKLDAARVLSTANLETATRLRGGDHPYTLALQVNAALDMQATGDVEAGEELHAEAVAKLSVLLGPDHPETSQARQEKRAECDIEAPSI